MSRIGKLPVPVPSGVDVTLDASVVTVKGPKGLLSLTVAAPITVGKSEDGTLEVKRPDDVTAGRHCQTPACVLARPKGRAKANWW